MDTAIYSLSLAAIAFAVAIALKPLDKRITVTFSLLFSLYLALDDLATGLPNLSSFFGFLPGQWNWEGKTYSILLSIAVVLTLGISRKAAGLTLTQRNIKASIIATILYIPWAVTLGLLFKPGISAAGSASTAAAWCFLSCCMALPMSHSISLHWLTPDNSFRWKPLRGSA